MKDKNLLIMIDDDSDDHEILKLALEELEIPFRLLFFPDCQKVVSYFKTPDVNAPGFVFVDMNLPGITGGECLQHLQQMDEFDHPCIIFYSGVIPDESQKQYLGAIGVDKFLEKSGSLSVLVDQLRTLLI